MGFRKRLAQKIQSNIFGDSFYDEDDNLKHEGVDIHEIPNNFTKTKKLTNYRDIREVSKEYSPLAALILKMAAMTINGEFSVRHAETDQPLRGSKKGWEKLLKQPNPLQTRAEFFTQLEAYTMLAGYCYVKPVYPLGYTDRPQELWILPPQFIKVEPIEDAPPFATEPTKLRRVWFVYKGKRKLLDETKLILFKDIGSSDIDDRTWLPVSRVKNLEYPVTTGIGTYESMQAMTYDRGASGILSNQSSDIHGHLDIDPDEKTDLQQHYKKTFGLTKDKMSRIIIASANLRWQPMTFNVKDLMLHEQHASCIKDICAMYGFPHRLLTISEGATYNNQTEDKQSAYTDCIIPNSTARMEQWNIGLNTLDDGVCLKQTYDHLPILQGTKLDRGRGMTAMNNGWQILWNNGLCTKNQWLKGIGLPEIDNELFNKYKYELTPKQLGIVEPPKRNEQDNPAADSIEQGTEGDNPNDNNK